jgi:hypothetical protein
MEGTRQTEPRLLLAQWEREELAPEDVPLIASAALQHGCQSGAVAVLAGSSGESRRAVEDLLAPVLRDLGLQRPSQDEAMKLVADDVAGRIVSGEVEPERGARLLWRIANERGDFQEPMWSQLRVFVGLASELEDDPERRARYEADIKAEAQGLLDLGGLQV